MTQCTRTDPREKLAGLNGDEPDKADAAQPRAFTAVYRSMADVESREIEHLWSGYLVARKLNLVAGLGGVGKGQLMASLIARWSRGDTMPYEVLTTTPRPRRPLRILILAAEDDPHEDLRPCLDANGANLDDIFILDGVRTSGDDLTRWVDVERHMPVVMDLVQREQIDIVYLDPLSSYMRGVQRQSAGHVRDTIGHLQRLINVTGVTVIGTLHLGKSQDRRGAHRILGSVEFVNAARNVLGVADLPDSYQPEDVRDDAKLGRHRVIEVLKSNSSIPGKPLVWSRPLNGYVHWHGESPVDFDTCFRVVEPETRLDSAMQFLHDELGDAPKPKREVEAAARKRGLTDATLRRAKSELGVRAKKTRGDKDGPWLWAMPRQDGENVQTREGVHGAHDEPLLPDDGHREDAHGEQVQHLLITDPDTQQNGHSKDGAQGAHDERLLPDDAEGEGAQVNHREHLLPNAHLLVSTDPPVPNDDDDRFEADVTRLLALDDSVYEALAIESANLPDDAPDLDHRLRVCRKVDELKRRGKRPAPPSRKRETY